ALPFMQRNQIRVLGVASAARVSAVPDIPTLHEQAVGDGENALWFGLLTPAGTPPETVARFNKEINDIIRTKEMVSSLAKQGLIVSGGGPEVLRELIVKDGAKWAKVIADA